jgi:hypothetical protein
MSMIKNLGALALASLAIGAQAQTVTITQGANDNSFATQISLDLAAAVAGNALTNYVEQGVTFNGGLVLDQSIGGIGARPVGSVGNYWALSTMGDNTVSFAANTNYFSFVWGSPDTYNNLVVHTNKGDYSYTPGTGGLFGGGGDQSVAYYFNFHAGVGEFVTSVNFNSTNPAFEVDNFAVGVVPEPGQAAMLLAGLALIGGLRRRKQQA